MAEVFKETNDGNKNVNLWSQSNTNALSVFLFLVGMLIDISAMTFILILLKKIIKRNRGSILQFLRLNLNLKDSINHSFQLEEESIKQGSRGHLELNKMSSNKNDSFGTQHDLMEKSKRHSNVLRPRNVESPHCVPSIQSVFSTSSKGSNRVSDKKGLRSILSRVSSVAQTASSSLTFHVNDRTACAHNDTPESNKKVHKLLKKDILPDSIKKWLAEGEDQSVDNNGYQSILSSSDNAEKGRLRRKPPSPRPNGQNKWLNETLHPSGIQTVNEQKCERILDDGEKTTSDSLGFEQLNPYDKVNNYLIHMRDRKSNADQTIPLQTTSVPLLYSSSKINGQSTQKNDVVSADSASESINHSKEKNKRIRMEAIPEYFKCSSDSVQCNGSKTCLSINDSLSAKTASFKHRFKVARGNPESEKKLSKSLMFNPSSWRQCLDLKTTYNCGTLSEDAETSTPRDNVQDDRSQSSVKMNEHAASTLMPRPQTYSAGRLNDSKSASSSSISDLTQVTKESGQFIYHRNQIAPFIQKEQRKSRSPFCNDSCEITINNPYFIENPPQNSETISSGPNAIPAEIYPKSMRQSLTPNKESLESRSSETLSTEGECSKRNNHNGFIEETNSLWTMLIKEPLSRRIERQ